MWSIFRVNVLIALSSFKYKNDPAGFAYFYASEYDACMKRGGDMMNGVPVINGNVSGMASVIEQALKKGQTAGEGNFNLLQEICPAAFEAYWRGAEMAPIPNPILRPAGWPSTIPAPGAIANIGPSPTSLIKSAAKNKAQLELLKAAEDKIKNKTVVILGESINVYETAKNIVENKPVRQKLKNHPAVKSAVKLLQKIKEAKRKKPSTGSQIKKSIKIPFPKLPDRKKLIEEAKNKAIEQALPSIKEQIKKSIQEIVLQPIISVVQQIILLSDSIPNPKPTEEQIKKAVKDKIDGKKSELDDVLNKVGKIPTKEEFESLVNQKLPTEEELKSIVYDLIRKKIPKIPFVHFVRPTYKFDFKSNIFINPFINAANQHLAGTGGTISVIAQYPPPAPPGPAIIQWNGYRIIG